MPYKLKADQEAFRVVDGPFANRAYKHGEEYETVPLEEKHKFEPTRAASKPTRAGSRVADPGTSGDTPPAA